MKHTIQELRERQGWSLSAKIDHTLGVLDQFISTCGGKDKVYISVSGKDSCSLLHLARKVFGNDLKAVFCNTGNEYPDIVKHIRTIPNCEIIYPKYKPFEVLEKYGFPLLGKKLAHDIHQLKHTKSDYLRETRTNGKLRRDGKGTVGMVSKKWQFLAKEQFDCSELCCYYLKVEPLTRYGKETGGLPITGVMADESQLRSENWKKFGCNIIDAKQPMSKPLSIWTENDIWEYIAKYNVPIADIYHKGAKRTGCMFCGFGCQFKDDNRFEMLLDLHPRWYHKAMSYTNNGITFREALRQVLAVNKLYLPDEQPRNLFDNLMI